MNIRKIAYVDIGELGWSLNLSAHLRWLKENTDYSLAVYTSPDRRCLYKESADLILDIPYNFYRKFRGEQECFGLHRGMPEEMKEYFQKLLPPGYTIPKKFNLDLNIRNHYKFLSNKIIYKPYKYSKKLEGEKKILVFPRHRGSPSFTRRNIPELFYIKLIIVLCDEFLDYEVKTIGQKFNSHNIWNDKIKKCNYRNGVKYNPDLQALIDECQLAIGAVGSQSALPKLTLLQGVPTFMIGHQRDRHVREENWMKTKVGFYEFRRKEYTKFNADDCIKAVIAFMKESHA